MPEDPTRPSRRGRLEKPRRPTLRSRTAAYYTLFFSQYKMKVIVIVFFFSLNSIADRKIQKKRTKEYPRREQCLKEEK